MEFLKFSHASIYIHNTYHIDIVNLFIYLHAQLIVLHIYSN